MPSHAGLIPFSYSQTAASEIASHAATIPGQRVPEIQSHTASAAVLMPSHAGLIAFSYIQTAAAEIASQAATIPGQRTVLIQSHTAAAATLIAPQTFAQISCPVSVSVKNQTSAVTSRPIAAITQPITGTDAMPVLIERNTPLIDNPSAVKPPDAIHDAVPAIAILAANVPIHAMLSLTHCTASLTPSSIAGSCSTNPTTASAAGAIAGVICSMNGSRTSPRAT